MSKEDLIAELAELKSKINPKVLDKLKGITPTEYQRETGKGLKEQKKPEGVG